MDLKDIDKLAELARLEMSQEEKETILKDFPAIVGYIAQISEVSVPTDILPEYDLTNVMRTDTVTTDSGSFTDKLLNEMPDHEAGYLKVKQIL